MAIPTLPPAEDLGRAARRTGAGLQEHSGNTTEQTQVQQNPHAHTQQGNIFPSDGLPKQILISSFSKFPCSLSLIPPCLPLHHLTSGPAADSAVQPLIRVGHQCPIVISSGVADAASTYELGSSLNPASPPGRLNVLQLQLNDCIHVRWV